MGNGKDGKTVTRKIETVKRRYVVAKRATLRSIEDDESLQKIQDAKAQLSRNVTTSKTSFSDRRLAEQRFQSQKELVEKWYKTSFETCFERQVDQAESIK